MNTQKAAGSLLVMENALKGLTKAAGVLVVEEVAEILKQMALIKKKLSPSDLPQPDRPLTKMEQTLAKMREYQRDGGSDGHHEAH